MTRLREWLDATPLAALGLALMREATGRSEPLEPLRATRPERLSPKARVGFWALGAGVGTSTTAALVAQRSCAGGHSPLLVDLDRWAPSLAIRASIDAATIVDALVQPEREHQLVSRWANVAFLPGSPRLHREFDGARIAALLERVARDRAAVVDLGAGPDALDPAVVARLDRLVIVTGPRASQLQAAFCARELVHDLACPVGLVIVGVEDADAVLIASRTHLPLLAAIPSDPYLARDDFAARAPTMRAIDKLIRAL
jgi:MinD-like ATPase involved in chromosome partitioning or flagellar assembly